LVQHAMLEQQFALQRLQLPEDVQRSHVVLMLQQ